MNNFIYNEFDRIFSKNIILSWALSFFFERGGALIKGGAINAGYTVRIILYRLPEASQWEKLDGQKAMLYLSPILARSTGRKGGNWDGATVKPAGNGSTRLISFIQQQNLSHRLNPIGLSVSGQLLIARLVVDRSIDRIIANFIALLHSTSSCLPPPLIFMYVLAHL